MILVDALVIRYFFREVLKPQMLDDRYTKDCVCSTEANIAVLEVFFGIENTVTCQ